MQPDQYFINRADANAFKALVAFVSQDVFDERRHDGAISKSDEFLRVIKDAQQVLEQIGAYDYDHEKEDDDRPPYTFWWEGPFDLPKKEVEYALAKEVEGRPDMPFKRVHVNTAMPSGHFADLQFALDEVNGKICTLVNIAMARTELNLGPNWYDIGEDLETTLGLIVDGIETHPTWVWYCGLPLEP
ncbi:hypothetical protein GR212_15220 [Rhizobium lusitanum]|uniref:Uncharacterized protein n=1 Tax=Rhizobium lusitanum TaxID=293958 RepID=A0A6L9U4U4_9HYPH|nr:hypothetical protein [Rhizobium lusitanum]NEI70933.1 hypothetical protein [Rhizobium lusitanum]